jgi:thiamine biosynthesis lipoprotein
MSTPITTELRFRAMGCDVHVVVVDAPAALLERARARVEELDRRWTRFRPDSEVSQLNAAAGRPVLVSADTFRLVDRAVAAWHLTQGRFDPTLLEAIVALGYDRTFTELTPVPAAGPSEPGSGSPFLRPWPSRPGTGCAGIELDAAIGVVTLPAGTGFDSGGIGKGLGADVVARELLDWGAAGALVNLGGDVRMIGRSPTEHGWIVGIEDPTDPSREIARFTIAPDAHGGAVATSTVARRAWVHDGEVVHHLLDPADGRPLRSGLSQVSVVAAEGWRAEALTKAAFVAGADGASRLLRAHGVIAVMVTDGGEIVEVA